MSAGIKPFMSEILIAFSGIVRHLANFGVVTGILSLGIGPFTQMLISLPVKLVHDHTAIATAPRAENFNGYDSTSGGPG
jgi:hypothetical protein